MTPDFTLIWPLSCLKDGVHLCMTLSNFIGPLTLSITGGNLSLWDDRTV